MKKRNLRGVGAMAMAAVLTLGMVPGTVYAAGPQVRVASDSDVQMSSDPEAVYVNSYSGTERSENFNDNWKFYLGDASGAEEPGFNDSSWEQVNLPIFSEEQDGTERTSPLAAVQKARGFGLISAEFTWILQYG